VKRRVAVASEALKHDVVCSLRSFFVDALFRRNVWLRYKRHTWTTFLSCVVCVERDTRQSDAVRLHL